MRIFSNASLFLAVLTRRFDRLFQFFIAKSFQARTWELRNEPKPETVIAGLVIAGLRRRDPEPPLSSELLRAAVRMGLPDVQKGALALDACVEGVCAYESDREMPIATTLSNVEVDASPSPRSLKYAIECGDELEAGVAAALWAKHYPSDPVPDRQLQPTVGFERTSLNGSFKVTPQLKALIRDGVRLRREKGIRTALLIVANKTNTVLALGLGKLGDEGGVTVPTGTEVQPFFLTDHGTRNDWLKSSDFRRALAKGWLEVLPVVR
jgi:hypothetical protein